MPGWSASRQATLLLAGRSLTTSVRRRPPSITRSPSQWGWGDLPPSRGRKETSACARPRGRVSASEPSRRERVARRGAAVRWGESVAVEVVAETVAGPGLVLSKIRNRVAYSRSMSAGAECVEREGLGGASEKGDGEVFTAEAAQDGAEQAKRGMGAGTQGEGRVGGGDLTELGAGAVGDDGGRGRSRTCRRGRTGRNRPGQSRRRRGRGGR